VPTFFAECITHDFSVFSPINAYKTRKMSVLVYRNTLKEREIRTLELGVVTHGKIEKGKWKYSTGIFPGSSGSLLR
jgi:hypothetical protein